MRPVDRGAAPSAYAKYQDAAEDLQSRIGDYCSYCERQIETNLAIEHIQPKSLVQALATVWENFLLACVNCNSCKGHTPINLPDYFWPDQDNTLRAFEYTNGGLIRPRSGLSAAQAAKAAATIDLLGLDRDPGNTGKEPSKADRRWLRRQQTWVKAEKCKERLEAQNTEHSRELIVEIAVNRGGFSIWWTVFAYDPDMKRRLREAFIGTHIASFDHNEDLVARVGGQV